MPKLTIILAVVLIIMGAVGYVLSDMASVTALIPSFFGIAFLLCGLLALREGLRMHAMHGAALLALIGIGGSSMGLAKLPALLSGTAERPLAVIVQCSMAVLLVIFMVLCVRSFIAAKRARQAQARSADSSTDDR